MGSVYRACAVCFGVVFRVEAVMGAVFQNGKDLVVDLWTLSRNFTCDIFFFPRVGYLVEVEDLKDGLIALKNITMNDIVITVTPRSEYFFNSVWLEAVN